MKIRLRRGGILDVDVRDACCPTLTCFWAARHVIRGYAGSVITDSWECGWREQRGCPPMVKVAAPPRYRKRRGVWESLEEPEGNKDG